ncbi:unnamed protein product [Schistosoma margrebowiei]|uniref:Uncharacterized protein n=1 Tax=Schistosoma margrebowiei TaxID=48269 RepID=A0A183MBE0_9TREM|nr:unnamed protein product [Schistosoma margrebowiei]
MESLRPKEKKKTRKHITPVNGDRHEKDEQELDGPRKEGPAYPIVTNVFLYFYDSTDLFNLENPGINDSVHCQNV